jgi:hypothetical protein
VCLDFQNEGLIRKNSASSPSPPTNTSHASFHRHGSPVVMRVGVGRRDQPRTNDMPHPNVHCVFCPKIINNASVSHNLLPHLMNCNNAPQTVAIEARQLLEAAAARRPRLAVSPARRVHARRYSTTPTRQRRASLQDASITSPQAPTDRFDRADANAVRMQITRTVYAANLPFLWREPRNERLTDGACPAGWCSRPQRSCDNVS